MQLKIWWSINCINLYWVRYFLLVNLRNLEPKTKQIKYNSVKKRIRQARVSKRYCSIMIFFFDLDDTLYNEKIFLKSGFNEVSKLLSKETQLNKNCIYKRLTKF